MEPSASMACLLVLFVLVACISTLAELHGGGE